MEELQLRIAALQEKLEHIWRYFDIAKKEEELSRLEKEASRPTFWDSPETAQAVMRDLAALREEVDRWKTYRQRLEETAELWQLAVEEEDRSLLEDVAVEVDGLEAEMKQLEFKMLLSGPHDRADAILAIHAGAGGTDAQDWAQMLLRMYLRWAEAKGYKTELLDKLDGEEAGIKRAMVRVSGPYAYGYLRAERGVHRLVRLSPFDAAHRRHTSFALVEVWPDIADEIEIEIDPNDLQVETFRAAGAGGQHVQKNETAVRITHIPTGIVVSCQNERSQTQNRETALRILRARLYELEERKKRAELAALKGEHVEAGWGNQIRSYVLHPYQMVKDHRTGYETGNTAAVLDGALDPFIEAYLRAIPERA
ncbi:MAG: peptide chain release factor 2 [Chloroflexi bacterium]|nr:MAG: peptide chain release factor 2 [Chloroflexota bacterium]